MEDSDKLPLKRVELSLTKFNEVAIPHHLDLLRQHKANILKYEERGEYGRVVAEQRHARRVSSQLRALLSDVESLRARVRPEDRDAFDSRTRRARDLTLAAIVDYLGVIERGCRRLAETSPLAVNRASHAEAVAGSAVSTESVGVVAHVQLPDEELVQLQHDEQELELKQREELLEGWSALQAQLKQLHDTVAVVHQAAHDQRTQVSTTESLVEEAAGDVAAARGSLSVADRLSGGLGAAGGAALGLVMCGPVGLVAGAKVGALAAAAGSCLGYLAGTLLTRARSRRLSLPPVNKDD